MKTTLPLLLACCLLTACASKTTLERIRIAPDNRGFVLAPSGKPFHPWGHNYGNNGRLIEDYWDTDWPTVEKDFRELKSLGANVVRVHLQFGKFMVSTNEPNIASLRQLDRLVALAERTGIYLDLTGLACYRTKDVPAWYDRLTEPQRWAAQARFWEAVAEHCAKSPAIFCYDLINEPISPVSKRTDGGWYSGKPFGGYDFVQFIALDPGTRIKEDVANRWINTLSAAIRKHDRNHLITVGLWVWSGFTPVKVAPSLDFLCVHIYPETGKHDAAMSQLRMYAVGKPLVIEETFPLSCNTAELEKFLRESRAYACGWIGHYDGKTIAEYEALRDAKTITMSQAIWLEWLRIFRRMTPEMCPEK
jgi:hypothetical protein